MSTMDKVESLRAEALKALEECSSAEALEELRISLLGRKGRLSALFGEMRGLAREERPPIGREINRLKEDVARAIAERRDEIEKRSDEERYARETADVSLPGVPSTRGARHPVSLVMDRIIEIFAGLGFSVEEGPEIETDFYNFDALNFPRDHPARDMQDTIYIGDDLLMRTHTSPVQIRVMQRDWPPLSCVMPGRVYRCDYDVSHSPMFHQVEGLVVGEGVNFSHLKGVLSFFVRRMFNKGTQLRFRPSFFPFTEPSAEVDISCLMCSGRGCRVCGRSGWLEILGAGMVHPAVFEAVGYDPEKYTGYAFGMGVERIAMLRYRINDIRLLFENDVRFLHEFG